MATGRQQIITRAVDHILKHNPSHLNELRVWEVIEGVVSENKRQWANYSQTEIQRYWNSFTDPDGKTATRLVNDVIRKVKKCLNL